jgi:hypothetical protein
MADSKNQAAENRELTKAQDRLDSRKKRFLRGIRG